MWNFCRREIPHAGMHVVLLEVINILYRHTEINYDLPHGCIIYHCLGHENIQDKNGKCFIFLQVTHVWQIQCEVWWTHNHPHIPAQTKTKQTSKKNIQQGWLLITINCFTIVSLLFTVIFSTWTIKNDWFYSTWLTSSRVNFSVSPLWWSVALGKGHQLQHVEGIFPASNILFNVLNPTSFSPHTVQSTDEEILAELVFITKEGTLL